jgi:hypothetical protein
MKVISFGGHDINDGENYSTYLLPAGQTPPEMEPMLVGRTGAPAVIGGVVTPARFLVLRTTLLVQYSDSTKRELQQQWYAWFITDTTQNLIIADDEGTNQRYVVAMPFSIVHEEDGDGLVMLTTLAVDGDVLWRAVTPTTYAWNITSSGDTLAVVNGDATLNDDAYPVITITPRQYASGIDSFQIFAAVGWRATQGASLYPTDICNDGLDTRIASTDFASATGDDIRVYVDGVEADYWLDGINTATTKIWVNIDWQAAQTGTLSAAMGTGSLTTVTVNEDISQWPSSGLFLIDSEVFAYTGRNTTTKTFTGVTRASRGTTAAAHDAADAVTWVQHEIWIEYGDATLDPIVPDNDYKPMFVLTSSNTSWDYDEFYDLVSGSSRMQSRRTGRWTPSGTGSNVYGGNQNTTDDPYEELGLASSVAGTKAAISYYWSLFNPCGITAANFQNGQFWHGRGDWWAGYVQSSSGGAAWTTNYSIPTSSNETWNSWSQNVTGLTVNYVRLWLSGYASLAKPMRLECADVTVTLNSSYTPLVVLAAADQTYRVQPTIENQTTEESITIDAAVDVDQSIEIDVANHQVTLLADDSDAYNAVETVEGVRRWILRLQAGSNTLSYTQTGLVEVDVDIVFERRYRV